MKSNTLTFICPECSKLLNEKKNKIICEDCNREHAIVSEGMIVFHGTGDKAKFFDKRAESKLEGVFADYSLKMFKESLERKELFEMDLPNKKVGIAKKLWWEDYTGRIKNSSVLEVGGGVNYIIPYWLYTNNKVTAFDICKDNVLMLKNMIKEKIGLDIKNLNLFVGDVECVVFDKCFDIINISNVLHHIDNKKKALENIKRSLKDSGKVLIVEPNYYYPFRWIIETDFFGTLNFVKSYFIKNNMIDVDEKAIIFSELKTIIREVGFVIEVNITDYNYLGYGITHFIDKNSFLPKLIFKLDKYIFNPLIPRFFAPFEYLILRKA